MQCELRCGGGLYSDASTGICAQEATGPKQDEANASEEQR